MRRRSGWALGVWLLAACGTEAAQDHAPTPSIDFSAVIDIHGHIGTLSTDFGQRDISTEQLLALVERYDVGLTLVSNVEGSAAEDGANRSEEQANADTFAVVQAHAQRLRGLLWARPNDGSAATLARFAGLKLDDGSRAFVGMKLHPDWQGVPADDARMDPYMDLCAAAGLPLVVHTGAVGTHSSPERIYALARRYPDVPVVLYHMGFFGEHEPAIAAVEQAMRDGDADLYLETSECDSATVLEAVRRVSPARVVFGSDVPYFGATHYDTYRTLLNELRLNTSAKDYELITRGTAQRLFRL